jgi:hypothetical protein
MKNMALLGNNTLPKVNIFSFLIKSRHGKFLHPNYVTILLSDLFGIQTRSGCSCAALFGQKLLGIDLPLGLRYKEAMELGNGLMKVGYVRFNASYFFNVDDINYLLNALEFVSTYGWMFVPAYSFDKKTAICHHVNAKLDEQIVNEWLEHMGPEPKRELNEGESEEVKTS